MDNLLPVIIALSMLAGLKLGLETILPTKKRRRKTQQSRASDTSDPVAVLIAAGIGVSLLIIYLFPIWGVLILIIALIFGSIKIFKKGEMEFPPRRPNNPHTEKPLEKKEITTQNLKDLDWIEFEHLIVLLFQAQGYNAERSKHQRFSGADGGIDIQATHSQKGNISIQCKAWSKPVGVEKIREFVGALVPSKNNGVFVATAGYTQPAIELAKAHKIQILTGEQVLQAIHVLPSITKTRVEEFFNQADINTPSCPNCEVKMILRTGATQFWGCRNYPTCKSKFRKNPRI